jgi:hypothetical protein
MHYEKVLKFSITSILCISPDSAPYSVSRILRDCQQSKSESAFQVLPLVHCVPIIINSSLFIGFEHMSNEWKVEKVNYDFGIESFLRFYLCLGQKFRFLRLLKSAQSRISAV